MFQGGRNVPLRDLCTAFNLPIACGACAASSILKAVWRRRFI
jgi:hypothetical protein